VELVGTLALIGPLVLWFALLIYLARRGK